MALKPADFMLTVVTLLYMPIYAVKFGQRFGSTVMAMKLGENYCQIMHKFVQGVLLDDKHFGIKYFGVGHFGVNTLG